MTWAKRQPVRISQPLELEKVVKTSLAEFFGALAKTAITVITNPAKCATSEPVSILGNVVEPHVLKPIVTAKIASIIRVNFQFEKTKDSSWTATTDCIIVAVTMPEPAVEASQPSVLIQPAQ